MNSTRKGFEECVWEETAHFSKLKISKVYKLIAFPKTLQILKQEWQKSLALGTRQTDGKILVWLEKWKENWPNYQCLPLLTVRHLTYFQCCGSGMFIPDLGSDFFPSRIRTVSIPDPHQRISILTPKKPKKWFLSSRKYDPGCSSRIPDPDADFQSIPDPGVKKAPDPGSGSATLIILWCRWIGSRTRLWRCRRSSALPKPSRIGNRSQSVSRWWGSTGIRTFS